MSHPYPLFSLTLSLTKVCCPYPSFSHIYILLHPTIFRPYPSISLSLKSIVHIHQSHTYIHPIMSRPYPLFSLSLSLKSIVHIHHSLTYIHPIMPRPYPLFSLTLSLTKVYSPYPSFSHIYILLHTPYHLSSLSINLSLSLKSVVLIHQSHTYIHPTISRPYPSISLSH